jgi:3-dehydroquinate synthase
VKYGLIGDADFFAWCDANGEAMLAGDAALREYAVAHSVAHKARIVAQDERETTGRRALLNLGHTFGHALEAETGFSAGLLHGEAVAAGMVLAARYSARLGLMPGASAEHVASHFAAAGLRSELSQVGLACSGEDLIAHMLHDKKMDAGSLPFVLMNGIGKAFLAKDVELTDVTKFLDEQLAG